MMIDLLEELLVEYTDALESYMRGGGEAALDRAYEVGRAAVDHRLGVLDVTHIHQEALETILNRWPNREGSVRRVKLASGFLSEALASFEMTQRGYQETLEQLRQLNQTLEDQVADRTATLTAEIAERKRAEQAVRESEKRYRLLFEFNPQPMWVFDLETLRFLTVNDAAVNHYGYSHDEFLGMTLSDIRPPEEMPALLANLAEASQRLEVSGPWKHRKKDGTLIDVEITSHQLVYDGRRARLVLANDITRRLRAEDGIKRRLAEQEAVNHISTALRAAQSLDEMLPLLLDETLAVLQATLGGIWLYAPAEDALRMEVQRGWRSDDFPMVRRGQGIAGRVLATGEPYTTLDLKADPNTHAELRAALPEGLAGAYIPIRAADQVSGVIFVTVPRPRELTEVEVRLLLTVAEIAGNAIHRMQLHEQTEQRLHYLTALRAIDLAISSSVDLGVVLNVVLDQVTSQLRVDAASILLNNPHLQTLEYAAGRGFHSRGIEKSRWRLGEGYSGRAAFERRTIIVSGLPQDDVYIPPAALSREGFVACATTPLIVKGQVVGVLEVLHRSPLAQNQEWLEFLEALAGQAAIAIESARLFEGLQRSNVDLALAYDTTLEGWSRALDMRDRETEGHTQRVTEMTVRLAQAVGMRDEELMHVRRGALLHDIGKMGIPDSILLKPGPLSEEEWAIMRMHATYAYELLAPIHYLRLALDIPYCHHEKWDGTGYPRGLTGEQIPLAARIFAVVDVWDALRSDRPYRLAWNEDQVREHIQQHAGSHFDPQVVEIFLRLLP